jgi:hypothetical protein
MSPNRCSTGLGVAGGAVGVVVVVVVAGGVVAGGTVAGGAVAGGRAGGDCCAADGSGQASARAAARAAVDGVFMVRPPCCTPQAAARAVTL